MPPAGVGTKQDDLEHSASPRLPIRCLHPADTIADITKRVSYIRAEEDSPPQHRSAGFHCWAVWEARGGESFPI